MNKTISALLFVAVLLLVGGGVYYMYMNVLQPVSEHEEEEVSTHADNLNANEISPSQTVQRMQSADPVILLDVRTKEEYETLHLQDALLLPVSDISQNTLREIGLGEDMKDAEIILYGRSGTGAHAAYRILDAFGYTNLKVVSGGIVHWKEDAYPLTETGAYTGPSIAQRDAQATQETGGPRIVLKDTFYDFGEIPQYGGVVQKDFTVTNGGTETLEVGDITTSCSCTSASISNASIEPGASATLSVVFDPNVHEEPKGVFTRTVFVPSNDPTTPEMEVTIQVDILEGR